MYEAKGTLTLLYMYNQWLIWSDLIGLALGVSRASGKHPLEDPSIPSTSTATKPRRKNHTLIWHKTRETNQVDSSTITYDILLFIFRIRVTKSTGRIYIYEVYNICLRPYCKKLSMCPSRGTYPPEFSHHFLSFLQSLMLSISISYDSLIICAIAQLPPDVLFTPQNSSGQRKKKKKNGFLLLGKKQDGRQELATWTNNLSGK